jgi:CRISPR-associated protein Csm3
MSYKLVKKIVFRGDIVALTGIAIGGSNTAMGIGGVDKGVVRNLITQQPYIPGSTLKGKMRSLLELAYGQIGDKQMGMVKNGPSEKEGDKSTVLFGNASNQNFQRPSRVIVRDAYLSEIQADGKTIDEFFKNTELLYTEVKTEVVIDRVTSKAMPRQLERVPAGAKFNFELVLNVFSEDNEQELLKNLFTSLRLLHNDYIGGSGSRGSGQIRIDLNTMMERNMSYYTENATEIDLTATYKNLFPK